MSDDQEKTLFVEGALFGIEFFFMCEQGHVHTASVKFEGLKPEALNEENLTKLRDDIMKLEANTPGHKLRPATQEEIGRYMMQEEYAEATEKDPPPKSDKPYFMMPGPKEAQ